MVVARAVGAGDVGAQRRAYAGHAPGGVAGGGRHRGCRHAARAARVHGERGAGGGARRGGCLHGRALLRRGRPVPHERRGRVPQGAGRRVDAAGAGGGRDVRERGARPGARGPGRPGRAGRGGGHRGGAGALGAARARAGAAALCGGARAWEQRSRGRLRCRRARGAFGRRALRRADGGGEPVVRAGHRVAEPLRHRRGRRCRRRPADQHHRGTAVLGHRPGHHHGGGAERRRGRAAPGPRRGAHRRHVQRERDRGRADRGAVAGAGAGGRVRPDRAVNDGYGRAVPSHHVQRERAVLRGHVQLRLVRIGGRARRGSCWRTR